MRILLVDDDAAVLQSLATIVGQMPGHEVRTAGGGEEAFQLAVAAGGTDLLITDVVMDGVDGLSLKNELQNYFPGMRTIFVSGFDLTEYAEQIGNTPLLAKPLEVESLRSVIAAELAQIPQAPSPVPVPASAPRAVAVPRAVAAGVPTATPVPQARPVAVPAAAAIPRATPVPQARPVAVPAAAAIPTATPVPQARPVAAPVAAAIPAATPVPQARPVAAPAAAVPKARAAAVPAGMPVPVPAAAPRAATPVPASTPVPMATPVPKARPVASAAAPVARATAAPAAAAATAVEIFPTGSTDPNDPRALGLIGQAIGGYRIVAVLGEGRWGPVFTAVQTAINRTVGLKLLHPSHAADETQRERFFADARAKANVQHPSILSVYEAGAADPWIFYTQEYVEGHNLSEMAATGHRVNQPIALKLLRATAEAMLYFEKNSLPHSPLDAGGIYLGNDGLPRIANLATLHADQPVTPDVEIEALGRAILAVLPTEAAADINPGLRTLLGRAFRTNASPIPNWAAFLQGIKALEPKVVPIDSAKISAQDRAAVEAVERARKQQQKAFLFNVGAMVSLLILAIVVAYFVFFRSNERRLTAEIAIPEGDFVSGHGVPSKNTAFSIDKYEVTVGQYAQFVQFCKQNPSQEHAYDHPKQPFRLSHIPQYWDIYYGQAVAGGKVHGVPTSLNAPVVYVTWWDAYAYAKWKGRELPTALEWERAARGVNGLAFPWGEEAEPKNANTNVDYNAADPKAKGSIDGFNFWGDVDAQKRDKSPDGVIGMAGNVSEWTATWTPENKFPIIKGGNFAAPMMPVGDDIHDKPAATAEEYIGFRTISRAPRK